MAWRQKESTPGIKLLSPFRSYFWFLDYREISSVFFSKKNKMHTV
jgi:hypothetical protein